MTIVVNGTFDILHRGHIEMLEYAKSLGDQLLVCIDTDRRVTKLKGPTRPINNQQDRAFVLQSLKCVDIVKFFDSTEELIEIIEMYKPNIMVKGSDYIGKPIVGESLCKEIKFYDRTEHSTTEIIQRIIDR
jgi:D-beta-D-heptose 7-phosphate kinase/D-beta-D-heptose 1-phosphate adenosyltransferase